jgi:hypothetical protein
MGFCKKETDQCLNGGVFNPAIKKCQCHNYHGSFCEDAICFNGGTFRLSDKKCLCIDGFIGEHCEIGNYLYEIEVFTLLK